MVGSGLRLYNGILELNHYWQEDNDNPIFNGVLDTEPLACCSNAVRTFSSGELRWDTRKGNILVGSVSQAFEKLQ